MELCFSKINTQNKLQHPKTKCLSYTHVDDNNDDENEGKFCICRLKNG